ncbi:MAG: hypothetical protein DWC09_08505 [Candidatus Poseidoniales archaeon]|nr:MAG: hypothetical protein DWC09_08505 [Candidatus Poseidoniales archaeon]
MTAYEYSLPQMTLGSTEKQGHRPLFQGSKQFHWSPASSDDRPAKRVALRNRKSSLNEGRIHVGVARAKKHG